MIERQYGYLAPEFTRRHFLAPFRRLGQGDDVLRLYREVSRGGAKTISVGLLALHLAEYVVPFLPRLKPENRRILFIGRKIGHVSAENFQTLDHLIAAGAPWLKERDPELWPDPADEASVQDFLERRPSGRTWTRASTHAQFDLTNGVSLRGYGWDQGVRGNHAIVVFVDDLLDEENYVQAEAQIDTLNGAVMPAIEPGGILMNTGTPINPGDYSDRLLQDPDWNAVQLPAVDPKHAGPVATRPREPANYPADTFRHMNLLDLWLGRIPHGPACRHAPLAPANPTYFPDLPACGHPSFGYEEEDLDCLAPWRMNRVYLRSQEGTTETSRVKYLRERLLQRVSGFTILVHPNQWAAALRPALHLTPSLLHQPRGHPSARAAFCGVDPSGSIEDAFAFVVLGHVPLPRPADHPEELPDPSTLRLLHAETIPLLEGRADPLLFLDRLIALHKRYQPLFMVEGNGFQRVLVPLMDRLDPTMRIQQHMVTSVKHYMDRGWPMIRTLFESHGIEIPIGLYPDEQSVDLAGEARRVADQLRYQLDGIQYHHARIVEDPRRPNDLVSAFYLALHAAANEQALPSVSSVRPNTPDAPQPGLPLRTRPPERDPEFRQSHGRRDGPFDRIARANALQRRRG